MHLLPQQMLIAHTQAEGLPHSSLDMHPSPPSDSHEFGSQTHAAVPSAVSTQRVLPSGTSALQSWEEPSQYPHMAVGKPDSWPGIPGQVAEVEVAELVELVELDTLIMLMESVVDMGLVVGLDDAALLVEELLGDVVTSGEELLPVALLEVLVVVLVEEPLELLLMAPELDEVNLAEFELARLELDGPGLDEPEPVKLGLVEPKLIELVVEELMMIEPLAGEFVEALVPEGELVLEAPTEVPLENMELLEMLVILLAEVPLLLAAPLRELDEELVDEPGMPLAVVLVEVALD